MKIYDITTEFVKNYEPSITYLNEYFDANQEHFDEYFTYHCINKEEKMHQAVEKHPAKLTDILENSKKMPSYIKEITHAYETMYNVKFMQDVHLIVGIYGSNAYTYRQFNPEIAFCLEKLSPKTEHLQTIIAHEFGHATHNLISIKEKIDWSYVDWYSPYTWLLQEGVATYLSTKVVDARKDVYFAFKDDENWLKFCENYKHLIFNKFVEALQTNTAQQIFKEWFSINGGETFGVTRLGYFIAYTLVTELIEQYGELSTFTLWKEKEFKLLLFNELKNKATISEIDNL